MTPQTAPQSLTPHDASESASEPHPKLNLSSSEFSDSDGVRLKLICATSASTCRTPQAGQDSLCSLFFKSSARRALPPPRPVARARASRAAWAAGRGAAARARGRAARGANLGLLSTPREDDAADRAGAPRGLRRMGRRALPAPVRTARARRRRGDSAYDAGRVPVAARAPEAFRTPPPPSLVLTGRVSSLTPY